VAYLEGSSRLLRGMWTGPDSGDHEEGMPPDGISRLLMWESRGGKHGRWGKYKPWHAQRVDGWQPHPTKPLCREKVIGARIGPFKTKTEADKWIEQHT